MKNRAAQSEDNPTREQPQNTFEYEEQGCIKQGQHTQEQPKTPLSMKNRAA